MAAMKELGVLQKYFGYLPVNPGASGLAEEAFQKLTNDEFRKLPYETQVKCGGIRGFGAELRALSTEEKLWLAQRAARELNITQEQVEFTLLA